jgi:hypothetical protein
MGGPTRRLAMSLRTVHLAFITLCIMGADLAGAWAIHTYGMTHDPIMLSLGTLLVAGGLGLVAYAVHVVKYFDRAHLH